MADEMPIRAVPSEDDRHRREDDIGPWYRKIRRVYFYLAGTCAALCAVLGFLAGFVGTIMANYYDTKAEIVLAHEDKRTSADLAADVRRDLGDFRTYLVNRDKLDATYQESQASVFRTIMATQDKTLKRVDEIDQRVRVIEQRERGKP